MPRPWFEAARDFAHRKGRSLDPLLGRVLDRYLLAGKLGEGGMGAVYLAFQQPLNREVALKVISGMDLNEAARARFEREARAISLLDHPNIVKLYDYGIGRLEFEVPYMVLEYVKHGRTLRRALAELRAEAGGRIPAEVVLGIFEQVLHALGAAHEVGIIHRDMKPDNVMLARIHGNPHFVKVLDFGLAKAVQEVSGLNLGEVSHSGQMLGTPYYMAPEQAPRKGGAVVDGRADLYAVAVMLYEVFTGVRPHEDGTPIEIMIRKTGPGQRPLDRPEARALPRPLRDFLGKGLQPDPGRRFQDAAAMLDALKDAVGSHRLTAVGFDRRLTGSSQDRPATPPSPSAAEDRIATRPLDPPAAGAAPLAEAEGDARPPSRKPRWPVVAVPVVAGVLIAGVLLAVRPGSDPDEGDAGEVTGQTEATGGAGVVSGTMPPDPGGPAPVVVTPVPAEAAADPVPPPRPEPKRLSLEVRTTPAGAAIRVDGREVGPSPARYEFEVAADRDLDRMIEVAARLAGHREAKGSFRLREAMGRGGIDLALKRLPVAPRPPPKAAPRRKFELK